MRSQIFVSCVVGASLVSALAQATAEPHGSTRYLPSANGRASIAYDAQAHKLTQLLEHPYRFPQQGVETRNFAYDSYPGLRVGSASAWLDGIAPTRTEYVQGTGIVHVARSWQGLSIDEYDFAPMSLGENAAITVLTVTRQSGSGPISAYQLFNFHLGAGAPAPSSASESIAFDAGRDAFYEWGPSGVAMGYGAIGASSHHASTPNNPYGSLLAGQDLADNGGTAGATGDAVAGLEASLGAVAQNASATTGWFVVLAPDAQAAPAVDRVRAWIAGRSAAKLLSDEVAQWAAWQTPAPAGASVLEARAWAQAQATLKMAQVASTGASDGQIVASLAPGKWNIAWVRDMAYATVALSRSGHLAEAKRAIEFQLGAKVGAYQTYVGSPYQISVVRYFGDGTEESDADSNGPNIEFDGFGLFLWELEEYVKASGDAAMLASAWPAVSKKIADVLVSLQEPSGLIAADSSIWEVHWKGQQKHFAYTTITAAQGLCSASRLAQKQGDPGLRAAYLAAGQKARDALLTRLRAPDGTLAQATESLAAGHAWLDAAAVEAIGFGLVDANKRTARATLAALAAGLVPPSGRGFMRNDSGGWYDSQEWIFVDLRAAAALGLAGRASDSAPLLAWNVAQAEDNFGIFSELHDRVTADYAGEAPMVGFGAGAYALALLDRGRAPALGCEAYASEPDEPVDAGAPDGSIAPGADAAPTADGGGGRPGASGASDSGCAVAAPGAAGGEAAATMIALVLGALALLRRRSAAALAVFASWALLVGCSESPPASGSDAEAPGDGGSDASFDAGPPIDVDAGACKTTFRFKPAAGHLASAVSVAGEWDAFAAPGAAMQGPDADGVFTAEVSLAPGWYAYKLIVDGAWQLDPGASTRKYSGGIENSGVVVSDCYAPTLALASQSSARPTAGNGHYAAKVAFQRGAAQTQIDPASVKVTLRSDFATSPVAATVDAQSGSIAFDAGSLKDAKYTLLIDASDRKGRAAKTLRLVTWIEPERFDWRDATLYMAMTDRLKNGDPGNDVSKTAGVDVRADFQNGDLQGVRQVVASGALDKLGVRALWLTPFQSNPKGAFDSDDGVHKVTGYHGYWPTEARTVEPRIGGEAALIALVKEAHAHGIRVIMDFVVNHVHAEHAYFKAHPEWFRTGCLCGTNNCDWTTHRLDCLFASYMPDVNWTVPEVSTQYGDDAVYWLDHFDLDGFRLDAVKHVEDAASINLASRIRGEFEASGTRVFLTGETAMGWSDCDLTCNQSQYDTISHYIGPGGLDGQFDFPLYYAVPMQVFASDAHGMLHADYWTQASQWQYPAGAVMSPYVGSQDTPRFVTLADYRGQDGAHSGSVPGNKWTNVAAAPTTAEPYERQRLAMAWLLGAPGAPMIYYGDEYGEWGGADPNNRVMWRGEQSLSAQESTTLSFVRKLGAARRELVALRRGAYGHVYATEDVLVFARRASSGEVALVALSRATAPRTFTAPLSVSLALPDGQKLSDRLGGPDVIVAAQSITLTLASRGVAVLSP